MSELIATEHLNPEYTETTKLEWFIGLACNFSCTYCAEYQRSGFAKRDDIFAAVDRLSSQLYGRKIELLLGGGEPSIHPKIREIAAHIDSKGIKLSMISNGSRNPQLYVDMLKHIKHYTFSLHPEMDYQKTLDTIKAVHTASPGRETVLVNMMMTPGYFDEIKTAMEQMDTIGVRYITRRIRPLFDTSDKPILPKKIADRKVYARDYKNKELSSSDWGYYNQDELNFLNSQKRKMSKNTREFWKSDDGEITTHETNANEILLRKDNRFEGWSCYAGIERLHIYPNGDVYRSTCKVGGKLGNIYSDFVFPKEPVICTKKRCTCAWAVNLSKTKKPTHNSLLRASRADIPS